MNSKIVKTVLVLSVLAAVTLTFVGCATIISTPYQKVNITSTPDGATVKVDERKVGVTPFEAKLTRKDQHMVLIEMEGYEPYEILMATSMNGWVFGNIFIGGLVGIAIDLMSGAMYKLSPKEIEAELQKKGAESEPDTVPTEEKNPEETPDESVDGEDTTRNPKTDWIYVFVTMTPDPDWQKIGNMTPVMAQ